MKVLIELFSKHNINNVLTPDVFKPEKLIYVCSKEIPVSDSLKTRITDYVHRRNPDTKVFFEHVDRYETDVIIEKLQDLINKYPDCTIDITGGSNNMLFAVGYVCCESTDVQVITYSYKQNRFFNIMNAEYVNGIKCEYMYTIEDFITIAGGRCVKGRIDQESLLAHFDYIDPLFLVFLKYKHRWYNVASWIYHATYGKLEAVNADFMQKGIHGKPISCPTSCLKDLNNSGLISDLLIKDNKVSFKIPDDQIKFWLIDNGSPLEVYIFKCAYDSGAFNDIACSVIIEWNWEEENPAYIISNEVDVMAVAELTPFFISCKACKIDTYALNELDIIRKRFGGNDGKAYIISTEVCSARARTRAEELFITVIDINDINDDLKHRNKSANTLIVTPKRRK